MLSIAKLLDSPVVPRPLLVQPSWAAVNLLCNTKHVVLIRIRLGARQVGDPQFKPLTSRTQSSDNQAGQLTRCEQAIPVKKHAVN
jgi:hypothetical protein